MGGEGDWVRSEGAGGSGGERDREVECESLPNTMETYLTGSHRIKQCAYHMAHSSGEEQEQHSACSHSL